MAAQLPVGEGYFIVGGAGFIGSHFVDRLVGEPGSGKVTIYDNFSSGRRWHFEKHLADPRFSVVEGDVRDLDKLIVAMSGHQTVIYLASNPDIAKAVTQPDIDFYQGTFLTHQVVEGARRTGVATILYASGSGIYGDLGEVEASEQNVGQPVSTYGASKLAGEALISAYSFMFGLRGRAFRFGNVVGAHQTHGVGFDFVRRLLADPRELRILGDGRQSKSYIHVEDVVDAVLAAHAAPGLAYDVFNVATGDYITVTEIAELALECVGLRPGSVRFCYSGGDRGWKGDVPVIRLATERIRGLGWRCRRSSREALRAAMMAMVGEFRAGAALDMGGRAVFLDRDGVLNRAIVVNGVPHPPASLDELEILPGVVEACAMLRDAGFRLIVVTNQPDIARGTQTLANVERLNGEVRRLVGVDDVFVCPHDDGDRCACRKPKPGLLLDAARLHGIDLARSVMVGDRDRDIEAGRAAGCRTVFVMAGYGRAPSPPADLTVARLREALPWIISEYASGTAR